MTDKIISIFFSIESMQIKTYCNVYNKYRKFRKTKISYI